MRCDAYNRAKDTIQFITWVITEPSGLDDGWAGADQSFEACHGTLNV